MKYLPAVVAFILLFNCSSHKSIYPEWVQMEQWDLNKDNKLDSVEFQTGYLSLNFYMPWTAGNESTGCPNMMSQLFTKMDFNHDRSLDSVEIKRRNLKYLLGHTGIKIVSAKLKAVPPVDSIKFIAFADHENLCHIFDNNGDHVINAEEFAKGMFRIADQDGDGITGGMEFYLWEIDQPHLTKP